ncbi:acetylglutamate kinase [Micromonospora sp. DT229]|uniref:acetylglutamate kinase n=1 Tax=Micromonospora sp. DT229 TaxID=3393430 RepID=UPI003CEC3593
MTAPVVLKCGGAAGVDIAAVCAQVAALWRAGTPVVLVHGGSAAVARLAARMSVPVREFVSPSGVKARHTDDATLEVLTLALLGEVKTALLLELHRQGVRAVGLSGADGALLRARRKQVRALVDGRTVVLRDDHSGMLTGVDDRMLTALLRQGLLPVVSPPAVTEDGALVNVNADRVAARVAVALGAAELVLLTAASGVLDADGAPLPRCALAAEGPLPAYAEGGMKVKLIAAREALLGGVPTVTVRDGRTDGAGGTGGTRVTLA